jgi:CNT family concentrative nucleoside transporter
LKTPFGRGLFQAANAVFLQLLEFTKQGSMFIFGNLVNNNVPVGLPTGTPVETSPISSPEMWANTGASLAFFVLPTIIVFSSLMSVLYYLGVMQWVVRGIAWIMQRTMRTSGAETLSVAGNIFVGQTESPLLIRPFIGGMTVSEIHTVMVGGFATIAGGVMAAYVGMLSPYFPDVAGHLLTASVMNAPAALFISKMLMPESGEPATRSVKISVEKTEVNLIDAAAAGAAQGLKLALNVGAMLLAFIALIAMINAAVSGIGGLIGFPDLSMETILGWVLSPLAWLMGVPWSEAGDVGSLMGLKVVVNEFVAYLDLAFMLNADSTLSPRAAIIATYALLGFANFASIAIQIGGIGGIAPERRADLSRVGVRAMIGGNLAAFMSASLAGMIL